MNLFNKFDYAVFAFVLVAIALVTNGCAMGVPVPTEAPDEPAVEETGSLTIIPGNVSETTREPGTLQGVLLTAIVRNTTTRPIEFGLPTTSFHGRIGAGLGSTFRFVSYTDSDGTALGGMDGELSSSSIDYVTYDEVVRLEPGQVMELVLRANVLADADNVVEIGMGDGGLLLVDARYADTDEFVPEDRILGNEQLTRLVRVELP